jgi:ribosomal protein L31E
MDKRVVTDNVIDTSISHNKHLKLPDKVTFTNSHTTWNNSTNKVPSKLKSKIKLSRQLNDSVPLTVYHQNVRSLRGKAN